MDPDSFKFTSPSILSSTDQSHWLYSKALIHPWTRQQQEQNPLSFRASQGANDKCSLRKYSTHWNQSVCVIPCPYFLVLFSTVCKNKTISERQPSFRRHCWTLFSKTWVQQRFWQPPIPGAQLPTDGPAHRCPYGEGEGKFQLSRWCCIIFSRHKSALFISPFAPNIALRTPYVTEFSTFWFYDLPEI